MLAVSISSVTGLSLMLAGVVINVSLGAIPFHPSTLAVPHGEICLLFIVVCVFLVPYAPHSPSDVHLDVVVVSLCVLFVQVLIICHRLYMYCFGIPGHVSGPGLSGSKY